MGSYASPIVPRPISTALFTALSTADSTAFSTGAASGLVRRAGACPAGRLRHRKRDRAAPGHTAARPRTDGDHAGRTARERIVEIAMQEWRRWGSQTVRLGRDDTSCVTFSPLPAPPPEIAAPDSDPGIPAHGSADREADPDGGGTGCVSFPDGTGMEATPLGCQMARRYWGIVGEAPDCQQLRQRRGRGRRCLFPGSCARRGWTSASS